jgi:L-aspartate oxidase
MRVFGAYVFDEEGERVCAFFAPMVILAAGGVGNLFLHTSNPVGATGDGIAMAYRIGTEILNAEYVQFHPTILFHRDVRRFLISEALRGEGAKLKNRKGEYFMSKYSSQNGDLAPRDEVARAIYREMESEDSSYVRLDATEITGISLKERFPAIYETCHSVGIDISKEAIPVVPAAHYFCGGIKVDIDGRTAIDGLYAAGENACTGVHGANRLASVSLLEGLYWGVRCVEQVHGRVESLPRRLIDSVPDWVGPAVEEDYDPVLVSQDFRTIQSTMWNYAGIIRSGKRLMRASADLGYLSHRVEQFYRGGRLTRRIIELRNSVLTALIIVRAARHNPVSKGCHYIE